MNNQAHHNDGPALAAVFSAALGTALIGLATIAAQANVAIKNALNWWDPAGPLTGKTGVGVLAWLLSWLVLHCLWQGRELPFRRLWTCSLVLILIGFLGTFPLVFEAFGGH